MREKMAKGFMAVFLVALLLAVTPARAEESRVFKIGISQFPSTLHPMFDEMVAKSLVLGTALRPVTVYNAGWQAECMLCTELPSFDNGRAIKESRGDGKTGIAATYTLKENLFWDDGAPVTTKDILFAWKVGKHPKAGVGNSEFFAKDIVDITVADARTFTLHFDKERCDFAPIGEFDPLPVHLEEKIFDENPETYKNRTLYNTAPATAGLYMGPYRIAKIDSGVSLTLARNPHWQGTAPYFDNVSFKTVENSSALMANLLAGDIDYIAGELGILLDEALAFEKRLNGKRPGKFTAVYKPGLTYEHIDLNLDIALFQDVRLRRALMLGMNRDAINVALFQGKQPVALSDINPLDSVFTREVALYPYDPAAAEKLLDEAGWQKRGDGLRYNAAGEKLTLVFSTTAGNKTRENIQQALQSDWKKIGIDVVIDNQPARVLFGDTMRERKFKGGVMYAWMSAPRNIPKTTLHSSMIPSAGNNYAGQNYAGYKNPVMDKILDDLEVVCAPEQNLALWHQLQKIYADELPALPPYYRADSFFIPTGLSGLVPTGHMNPSTLWIENWRME